MSKLTIIHKKKLGFVLFLIVLVLVFNPILFDINWQGKYVQATVSKNEVMQVDSPNEKTINIKRRELVRKSSRIHYREQEAHREEDMEMIMQIKHHQESGIKRNRIGSSRGPPTNWCKPQGFRNKPGPVVAIVSFPGSGNTWVRYLLQQLTGTLTGSIYDDADLKFNGFQGESHKGGDVIAVKTHEWGPRARSVRMKLSRY